MNCKTCGGNMIGDGYTTPIQCETLDLHGSAYEPDCDPVHCQPTLFDTSNVSFNDYINKQLETSFQDTPIKNLPQAVRVALYLYYDSQVALLGAVLRTKYKNHPGQTKYWEPWTQEEIEHWEATAEQLEDLFYSMTDEEREYLNTHKLNAFIGGLARGETIQETTDGNKKYNQSLPEIYEDVGKTIGNHNGPQS